MLFDMGNKIILDERSARSILSQARTLKTYATNLEANVIAFLDGVGAVQEKPKSKKIQEVEQRVQSKFYKTLKVKEPQNIIKQ